MFQARKAADFLEVSPPDQGRIETRRIWCSTALNGYLDIPHVRQVLMRGEGLLRFGLRPVTKTDFVMGLFC